MCNHTGLLFSSKFGRFWEELYIMMGLNLENYIERIDFDSIKVGQFFYESSTHSICYKVSKLCFKRCSFNGRDPNAYNFITVAFDDFQRKHQDFYKYKYL